MLDRHNARRYAVESGGEGHDGNGGQGGGVFPLGAEGEGRVGSVTTGEFVPEDRRDVGEEDGAEGFVAGEGSEGEDGGDTVK